MKYEYNDGGRSAVFTTSGVNDCVVRAIAIISERPYMEIWNGVHATGAVESTGHVNTTSRRFFNYMIDLGFTFVNCRYMLKTIEFPPRAIACLNGHYVAIVDGVMNDAYNASPAGLKTCLGYWTPLPKAALYNVVSAGRTLNSAPLGIRQAETMRNLFKNNYGGNPQLIPC